MNGLKGILATDSTTQESNTLCLKLEYVTSGLPQGSVLIYMNDIAKALPVKILSFLLMIQIYLYLTKIVNLFTQRQQIA